MSPANVLEDDMRFFEELFANRCSSKQSFWTCLARRIDRDYLKK